MNTSLVFKSIKTTKNFFAVIFMFLMVGVGSVSGTNYTWTGTTSTAWATTSNWSPVGNPGSAVGDVVIIPTGSRAPLLTVAPTNALASLTFTTTNTLTITTVTLAVIGAVANSTSASTGTVTGTGTLNCGSISIGNGAILTFGTITLNVSGTTTIGGGTSGTLNITSTTGTKTFTGAITVNAGATWNNSVNEAVTFRGGITNSGTFTAGTGVHTFNTNAQALTGIFTIPSVTVTGVILTNNNTLIVGTALAGTGTLANNGTLNIGGACSIGSTSGGLSNSGTVAITSAGNITTLLAGFTNTGSINLNGSGTIAGITNNAAGIVNLTSSGTITSFNNATATSTLNISDLTVPAFTTLTATFVGNTVNYTGAGAQTVKATTYSNLTLSGSGTKTTTGTTVTGILSIEGTATPSATVPSWSGTAYTLQYKTTDAHIAGAEWFNPFVGSGGIIIANTAGSITMNSDEVFNTSVPLTINNGAKLATNNFGLTFGGNFVNNGGTFTAGSSDILINSTAVTQNIAGFTTTGSVSMTKTTGTATFQSNVNAGTLTINGAGGTLNLGGGSSHTFIGANLIVNAGTLTLGATEALSNTSNIALGGGTFKTGASAGYTETLGTLILGAGSTISLGTGSHSLSFDASNFESWTSGAILTITGWIGGYNGTSGTAGKVFIGTNSNGLTASQLSQTIFYNGANYYTATMLSTGEVVPTSTIVNLSLSYTSPNSFFQNVAITPLTPTINFTPTSYSVLPALPAGLTLNTSTGIISGTPTTITSGTYTVTATAPNVANNKNFPVIIGIITGQSRYSVANGNWNSTSTWAQTSNGMAGASVPVAGDAVFIERGLNVTVTTPASAASITFTITTATSLSINSGITVNVSGAITIPRPGSGFNQIIVGAGILNAGSIAFTSGGSINRHQITISTGTVTVAGNVTTDNAGISATITFTDAGTLILGGSLLATPLNGGTLTTIAGSTVVYNAAGAQIVEPFTYSNLTLSGSGAKTTTTGVTVNGILSMEGTATSSALPTYGANATLQYKGTAAQTTGLEFPGSFTYSGGVIINNANGVTLNGAKIIGIGIIGSLALINGILTTNGNLLTINSTATTAIIGSSATSYINGILIRALPANLTSGFTYNFPVGVGTTYLPFSLVNATTTTSTATAQVQAFNSYSGGSVDVTLNSKSSTEYWSLVTIGGFSTSSVSLGRQTAIISNDVIGACATTPSGTYTSLGGTAGIYGVSTSTAIGTYSYFVLAAGKTPRITTSTANLTGFYYIYEFGPSSEQSFTVNGTSFSGNITVTPSTNMEISSASGTGFQSTALIVNSNNNVIYVRLKAGLAVGTYNTDNITMTSGATTNTIACRGIVLSSSLAITAGGGLNCAGTSIDLTSSGTNISNLYWNGPNNFFSVTQNQSINPVLPADYGVYTVTSSSLSGVNLVTNGDFEAGNTGFGSSYLNSNDLVPDGGRYAVVADPHLVHSGFSSCSDHTIGGPTPVGKQMVINGSQTVGAIAWSQTVNVIPGTYYQFSYWLQSVVATSASELQLYVNGVPAGPSKIATLTNCNWTPFNYNWNSGTATTAFLALVDKNSIANGNDFALDDIMFQSVLQITSSVNVTNNNTAASVIISASATNVRAGTSVTFTATPTNGGIAPGYVWKVNGVVIAGAISEIYSYVPTDGDVITCEMATNNGCANPNPAYSNSITMIVTVRTNYWIGTTSTEWNDVTNWTGGFVPASEYDIEFATVINNNGFPAIKELRLDFNRIIGSLINQSQQRLVITASKGLTVNNVITPCTNPDLIYIESSSTPGVANGSLIFTQRDLNTSVQASVEMYSKASINTGATIPGTIFNWQYFGIPISSVIANPFFYKSYVRGWHETGTSSANHWISLTNDSILRPFYGYELCQQDPKTFIFQGTLVNSDFSSGQLAYTSEALNPGNGALYPGQHIFANPYTAAIDITQLSFGNEMDSTVFLYNTGTYGIWSSGGGESAFGQSDNAGQYYAIPINVAGFPGIQDRIPSMSAMLVKAKSASPLATFGITYSSVVKINNQPQRAPGANTVSATNKIGTIIDVKGAHHSDRMWIVSDPTCTRGFDNGWDGQKMLGSALTPQLFAMEADGNYQVNSVPDMNNTELGFQAGQDLEYTLTFTHENIQRQYAGLYLVDLVENKTIDITVSGSTYNFLSESTPAPVKRFRIVTRPYEKDAPDTDTQVKIFSSQGSIFVQNYSILDGECMVYDIAGHDLMKVPFTANGVTAITNNLRPGAYIATAIAGSEKVSKRLIVR